MLNLVVSPRIDQQQQHQLVKYSMLQYHLLLMNEHTAMWGTRGDKVNRKWLVSLCQYFCIHTAKVHGVPSMKDILQISQQVAHKWRLVGLQLGVHQAELDQIDYDCGSDQSQCYSELFRKWAAGEVTASCPFTWRGVIETLDSSTVKESFLARRLESNKLHAVCVH